MWVSFDPWERTICGLVTMASWRGAAINVNAQPLNKQQVQLAIHIIEPPKTEVVHIPNLDDKKSEFLITLICLQSRLAAYTHASRHETHITSHSRILARH